MGKISKPLFEQISALIQEARGRAIRVVNQAMVELYWSIGRLIVEDEQGGKARATYGEAVIAELANRLTTEFGKGFDERNLRNMRAFFLAFPIRNALRSESEVREAIRNSLRGELSWTHYRLLLRVSSEQARQWYMNEAADAG